MNTFAFRSASILSSIALISVAFPQQDRWPNWHAGTTRIVVLVDSSGSMKRTETAGSSRRAKADLLRTALTDMGSAIIEGTGPLNMLPLLSKDLDELVVVHYGYVTGRANDAYKRVRFEDLEQRYARVEHSGAPLITVEDFVLTTYPRKTMNFNLTSWAFPLSLAKASPSPGSVYDRTIVVIVHDGQLNDGTYQLESYHFRQLSNNKSREYLDDVMSEFREVRLVGEAGSQTPLLDHAYVLGRDTILVTAFVVRSAEAEVKEAQLARISEPGVLQSSWSDGKPTVVLVPDGESGPYVAGFSLHEKDGTLIADRACAPEESCSVTLPEKFAGKSIIATLWLTDSSTHRFLGVERIWLSREFAVRVAEDPSWDHLLLVVGLAAGAVGVLALYVLWARYYRVNVRVGLPFIARSRAVRAAAYGGSDRFLFRSVPMVGDECLVIKIPPRYLRWLLMPGAVIEFDSGQLRPLHQDTAVGSDGQVLKLQSVKSRSFAMELLAEPGAKPLRIKLWSLGKGRGKQVTIELHCP